MPQNDDAQGQRSAVKSCSCRILTFFKEINIKLLMARWEMHDLPSSKTVLSIL